MEQRPAAEFHADAIDVHMDGASPFAMLTIVNAKQGLSVTLPRQALLELRDRISRALAA